MAKKKPSPGKKGPTSRKAVRKVSRPAIQKNPRKGARVVARKSQSTTAPSAPAAVVPANAPPKIAPSPSLGRPKVTGDEDLDMFFKEDFHARQIFKFLNVRTLKELERYSAGEILRRLSNPIKETVERIRRSLAGHNRCLTGDESYALQQKENAAKPAKG